MAYHNVCIEIKTARKTFESVVGQANGKSSRVLLIE